MSLLDPALGYILDTALMYHKQGYRAVIMGVSINKPYLAIRNPSGVLQFNDQDVKAAMWGALKAVEQSQERERENHRATAVAILKAMGIGGVTADLDTDFPKLVKQAMDFLAAKQTVDKELARAFEPATKRYDNLPPGVVPPGLVRKD